jgi:hypothetical protein
MTTTMDFATVAGSIAALTITGVTVKDYDQMSDALGMTNNILTPRPNGYITDISVVRSELSGQNLDVSYTLHYDYYHCAPGGMNGLLKYSTLVDSVSLILAAFAKRTTLGGAVDNTTPTVDMIGVIQDPAGNTFLGASFSIRILQFLEVT